MPEFHRTVCALLIGASGATVMISMSAPHWNADWPLIFAATLGAGGAGYLYADLFGLSGRRGLGFWVLGVLLATFTGAAAAGLGLGLVLAQTPIGVIFGPMAVAQALLTSPVTLMAWIFTMAFAQWIMGQIRFGRLLPS